MDFEGHGTINVAMKIKEGFIIGIDSRVTNGPYFPSINISRLCTDECLKIRRIGRHWWSTLMGEVSGINGMWLHLEDFVRGTPVSDTTITAHKLAKRAGHYLKDRQILGGSFIVGRQGLQLACYRVTCERRPSPQQPGNSMYGFSCIRVHTFDAIGSGEDYAIPTLQKWYHFNDSPNRASSIAADACLIAAINDSACGGSVSVYFIRGERRVDSVGIPQLVCQSQRSRHRPVLEMLIRRHELVLQNHFVLPFDPLIDEWTSLIIISPVTKLDIFLFRKFGWLGKLLFVHRLGSLRFIPTLSCLHGEYAVYQLVFSMPHEAEYEFLVARLRHIPLPHLPDFMFFIILHRIEMLILRRPFLRSLSQFIRF